MSDLLENVLAAHGGLDRWREVRAIDVTFNYWGALLDLKGYPGHRQPTATLDAHSPKVVFQRLDGDPDDRWVFTPERVWIERRDGEVLEQRLAPRSAFQGHVRTTRWDRLHLTYFIGYALWNYLTVPFLFTQEGFQTRELATHEEAGESWRVLEVAYPDDVPAHTKIQRLYFDATTFMLKRLDYETDVLGGVGAHYCFDHKTVEGLVFPTFRRVVRRTPDGPVLNGPTSFVLDYVWIGVR
jgi:hypothetical protein